MCQIGDGEWNAMCVLTLAMLATGAQAKEAREPQGLKEKKVASQETYCLEAYDCSEPEDAIVYNIPQKCSAKERIFMPELSGMMRQNYTILQEVATFNYPATLGIVHRSRGYYDYVWKSHIRIAAPAAIYQREDVPVRECAIMELTGIFRDLLTRMRHRLNHSAETNYFYSTVVGELTYSEAHSHCKGTYGNIGRNHMSNLCHREPGCYYKESYSPRKLQQRVY